MKKALIVLIITLATIPAFASKIITSDPEILTQEDKEFLQRSLKDDAFYAEELKAYSEQRKKDEAYHYMITAIFQGNRPIKSVPEKKVKLSEDIVLPSKVTEEAKSQTLPKTYKFKSYRNPVYENKTVHIIPKDGKYVYTASGKKRYVK